MNRSRTSTVDCSFRIMWTTDASCMRQLMQHSLSIVNVYLPCRPRHYQRLNSESWKMFNRISSRHGGYSILIVHSYITDLEKPNEFSQFISMRSLLPSSTTEDARRPVSMKSTETWYVMWRAFVHIILCPFLLRCFLQYRLIKPICPCQKLSFRSCFGRRLLASGQDRRQTLHACYFWQAASAGVQSTVPAHSKCAYAA